MRYALSETEWKIIQPILPSKPRGVPRVDDRRVLNGIFWVLRSGAPWRDLPDLYGPYTTCFNRFVRWRRAGVWDRLMEALSAAHNAVVQMIDTSVMRVHQHGASIANSSKQHMGRSRGGLTSKIHVVVDAYGLLVRLGITAGQVHDNRLCAVLLDHLQSDGQLLADRGTLPIGSERWLPNGAHGRTFHRSAVARPRFASAVTSIETAIWSSGSSTRSSIVDGWRPDTTSSPPTILPSSSSPASGYGHAFISTRPSCSS